MPGFNPVTITYGTTAGTAAQGNDTRFPASVTGIRKGAGAGSSDTAAAASDLAMGVTVTSAKSADFTVATTDRGTLFLVTTSTTDRTATLPTAATAGSGWYCWIRKSDSASGKVLTSPSVSMSAATSGVTMLLVSDGTNYNATLSNIAQMDGSGSVSLSSGGSNQNLTIAASGGGQIACTSTLRSTGAIYLTNNNQAFGWRNNGLRIYDVDANTLEVDNGTAGTVRDFLARGLRSSAVTFANAITSPVEGTLQAFTDSSVNTWGSTITGGGANHVLGYYNGTNWTVAAK